MAVAVVTDQGLQQAAAVGVRKWGEMILGRSDRIPK